MSIKIVLPNTPPKDLNLIVAQELHKCVIESTFKEYCDYLIDVKKVDTKTCKASVNKLLDVMVERGEISITSLDTINKYLVSKQSMINSITNDVITRTVENLQLPKVEIDDSSFIKLKEYVSVKEELDILQSNMFNCFGVNIKQEINTVINTYSKLLDVDFVKQFKK